MPQPELLLRNHIMKVTARTCFGTARPAITESALYGDQDTWKATKIKTLQGNWLLI